MTSNHEFTEDLEFDDFFRRGEASQPAVDSLQPVADMGNEDEHGQTPQRTPAQRARRAKLIKLVSVTMALMTVCSGLAFARSESKRADRATVASLLAPWIAATVAAPMTPQPAVVQPDSAEPRAVPIPASSNLASPSPDPVSAEVGVPLRPESGTGERPDPLRTTDSRAQSDAFDGRGATSQSLEPQSSKVTSSVNAAVHLATSRATRELESDPKLPRTVRDPGSKSRRQASALPIAGTNTVVGVSRAAPPTRWSRAHTDKAVARVSASRPADPKPEVLRPPTASFPD